MKEVSQNQDYSLDGLSRYVMALDLQQAELILTMDVESEAFLEENMEKVRAVVKSFGHFLPAGNDPHLPDPFLQRDEDYEAHYSKLITMIEEACQDLFESIPFMLG
tara:strand:- start:557 stop:874 length:318 start_codon:yes stop_codon:yes gene_type:complete